MKKFYAIVLSAAMVLGLTACGSPGAPSNGSEPGGSPSSNSGAPSVSTQWKAEKPITIINPYKAGGAGDLEVKAMQPALEAALGQAVITDYLTTGGGVAAFSKVYNAEPDGYTLLYISNPAAITKEFTDDVDYKAMDFTYLRSVSAEFRCIAARPGGGMQSLDDLVERAGSGELTIAHSGIGTSGHIQTLLVENALNINLNDVPFEGTAAAKAAFLGDHVDLWAIDCVSVAPLVESGDAVVLAICGPERSPLLPEVPTFAELGYEGVIAANARGFVAPPNLPDHIKDALITALDSAMESDGMISYGESSGSTWHTLSGDDYRSFAQETYDSTAEIADLLQ